MVRHVLITYLSSGALAKYDAKAFTDAGLPAFARGRFAQVAAHEATHVAALSAAIGVNATKPCNYSYVRVLALFSSCLTRFAFRFPYTDPKSFAALSSVLESVGVSAYLGAASLITEPAYVTVAGSILTTESRHQAWGMSPLSLPYALVANIYALLSVSSAVNKVQPWSGAFDTPLGIK